MQQELEIKNPNLYYQKPSTYQVLLSYLASFIYSKNELSHGLLWLCLTSSGPPQNLYVQEKLNTLIEASKY